MTRWKFGIHNQCASESTIKNIEYVTRRSAHDAVWHRFRVAFQCVSVSALNSQLCGTSRLPQCVFTLVTLVRIPIIIPDVLEIRWPLSDLAADAGTISDCRTAWWRWLAVSWCHCPSKMSIFTRDWHLGCWNYWVPALHGMRSLTRNFLLNEQQENIRSLTTVCGGSQD